MPEVLSLVNTISSTSIPVEIAHAVNQHTDSQVTVGGVMESPEERLDPDVDSMDLPIRFFEGDSNFDFEAYRRLQSHVQLRNYDVLHTHHNFSGSVARAIAQVEGIPIMNTEHNDLGHFTYPQRVANAVTYWFADVHVYNSSSTKSSRGMVTEKLSKRAEVIYNGVNIERVIDAEQHSLPVDLPSGTLITNVGVMTEQKNQSVILDVAKILKEHSTMDDLQFIIAGSGPLENHLQTRANKLGVDDIVTFTGYLPQREHVYKLLHQSDVFILPSLYEGFCVAAVEAMACELPIIANDIDVLREVIGEDGIFVDNNNPQSFAQRIEELISSSNSKKGDRAQNLQERAVTTFPLEKTAREYHELYLDIA